MPTIKIKWERFDNFFKLYDKVKGKSKLIYVIGEKKYCYIGCVGGRKGHRGLARRYDKPYIERAKSIFGSSTPKKQPAYAGSFEREDRITPNVIVQVEKSIQSAFIRNAENRSLKTAAFKLSGEIKEIKIQNSDKRKRPPFLKTTYIFKDDEEYQRKLQIYKSYHG